MTDRYERIREALAMGPTRGPFNAVRSYSPGNQELIIRLTCNDEYGITENYCTVRNSLGDTWKTEADAAFIAACDPDTIRALLAEREVMKEALEMIAGIRPCVDVLMGNADIARAALAAQPVTHPDDAAVDRFAAAMKAKLAKKRSEGRCGWQECSAEYLSALLREHVEKGDPVDVANFAMMLHQNGQGITPAEPVEVPSDDMQLDAVKSTAAIAWGWLWHVTTADDRVKTARDLLGEMLDKDLKRYGIQTAKAEGAQANAQEIEAAMLRGEFGDPLER